MTTEQRSCFWSKCSDRKRCDAAGTCVALSQAGGVTFPTMEPDTRPLSHMEILSAVAHHAREIVRLTQAIPVKCTPDDVSGGLKAAEIENACTHEFRPIDSSGQMACVYCNERPTQPTRTTSRT